MNDLDLDALKESLVRREAVLERAPPTALPKDRLEEMAEAADVVAECIDVLTKGGSNLVGELLRGADKFYEWNHYPDGDIYDTGLKVVVPNEDSPLKKDMFGEKTEFLTLAQFREWLSKYNLTGS